MNADTPTRIGFDEARAILARVAGDALLPVERVAPAQGLGRVLASDVVALLDFPAFDNSAMDGFAVRVADFAAGGTTRLRLTGEQFAGASLGLAIGAGECSRITTGAPLPLGADAVVMKEQARDLGDGIAFDTTPSAGQHLRRAGEDVRAGETVLRAGEVLTPAALSLAVAVGHDGLDVRRRPTVALFTTGDELRPAGAALGPGEIHDSNRVLLQALLAADGYHAVAWPALPDDPARLEAALADAAEAFDVVITCGGVSAGERDLLPDLLATRGVVHFWKVRMRPGMPLLAGQLGACQVLGLPGNPVSVFATYLMLARPFLDGLQGRSAPRPRWRARLEQPVRKRHDRLEFLRGRLHCDEAGCLRVTPSPADGSHRLRAAAQSDCLLVLGEGVADWQAGDLVDVVPLPLV
jgi:molybdopterin molybdotransferase